MANKAHTREAQARLRVYQARTQVNAEQRARRKRDNLLAITSVTVVFALAIIGQVVYFGSGPGKPTPTASSALSLPDSSLAEGRDWSGSAMVGSVPVQFTLNGALAPQAVSSEISLIRAGFYDNTTCHRLVTSGIYVLQCGDPKADGTGGPGYNYGPIENAPVDNFYPAGTIAMARTGNNAQSQGSQFFIVYQDSTIPADKVGGYTVVGRITDGLAPLQELIAGTQVEGGGTDGKPTVPIVLDNVTIQ
ncbi:MAG TPA: peptidylprolyl isomerase [Microbacteriaceae bacterium]|nr:peptidylprolyl isomerase [Microbacteriaceae bacterium]